MPTYDYQCRSCGSVTEVIHSMLEDGPTTCERCGGTLRRVLFPSGIIFKGSGFYRTDSRSGGSGDGSGGRTGTSAAPTADTAPGDASTGSGSKSGAGTAGTTEPTSSKSSDER